MKAITTIKILCFVFLLNLNGFAQKHGLTAIDSLKQDMAVYKKQDSTKVRYIYKITVAYVETNPDSARTYAKMGLALAKKLNWPKGIAPYYTIFGMLDSDNSRYESALGNYQKAYQYFVTMDSKRNMSSTLNNIGSLYQRWGNSVKSQEYSFKALKLAEEINDTKLIGLLNGNIGNVYTVQHNYKQALNYELKALKNYENISDNIGVAQINDKIGTIYYEQKMLKQAEIYFQRALNKFQFIDNKIGEATTLSHLGSLNTDADTRLGYMLKAQQIFDSTDPLHAVSITNLGNIGGIYADIFIKKNLSGMPYKYVAGNYSAVTKKAEEFLNRAIKYSKDAGDVDNLSVFSDKLAQLQEKEGDYKNAFNNYKLSRSISDSLYSQESKNKIAELTAEYDFQKKEETYKQQQQISALKMRQLILYAVLAVVLISGILVFLLYRSRISQLRLKNELQRKEAEEQTRELLHRNKLSESELKAIRAQMNPHFIFNVLNSIESYIMENDPKMACRLVQKFASLSRIILENSTQSLVVAEREWKALQLYTELEAIRFNHHFKYAFQVDPLIDLTTLLLPPMLVQPLIENSIHHGLRNSMNEDNQLSVSLKQTEHELIFTVDDNGVGLDEKARSKTSAVKSKSIGLSAIRERIDIINYVNENNRAEFEIHAKAPVEGRGTVARLKLPKIFRPG